MNSRVGIRVAHNLIHDMPRCGIFHGGALNTLEYNRIRHCNLEMEDTGCTYTGGWTSGWQTIRYGHCSEVRSHWRGIMSCESGMTLRREII